VAAAVIVGSLDAAPGSAAPLVSAVVRAAASTVTGSVFPPAVSAPPDFSVAELGVSVVGVLGVSVVGVGVWVLGVEVSVVGVSVVGVSVAGVPVVGVPAVGVPLVEVPEPVDPLSDPLPVVEWVPSESSLSSPVPDEPDPDPLVPADELCPPDVLPAPPDWAPVPLVSDASWSDVDDVLSDPFEVVEEPVVELPFDDESVPPPVLPSVPSAEATAGAETTASPRNAATARLPACRLDLAECVRCRAIVDSSPRRAGCLGNHIAGIVRL